jgi:protein gp37
MAGRFAGPGLPYEGLVRRTPNGVRWTGQVRLVEDELCKPLHWRAPRRVFVCSMSDLFHTTVPDPVIDRVFATILACNVLENRTDHTFLILTKRPARMQSYLSQKPATLLERWAKAADGRIIMDNADVYFSEYVYGHVSRRWDAQGRAMSDPVPWGFADQLFPLRNVWCGVSCENQQTANERIPLLMKTPAVLRFLSCEPLLERIDLSRWIFDRDQEVRRAVDGPSRLNSEQADAVMAYPVNWVIVGCESGPGARPMDPAWARAIKTECVLANVPYFFKQSLNKAGKKVSLPLLDGRRWQQLPEVRHD